MIKTVMLKRVPAALLAASVILFFGCQAGEVPEAGQDAGAGTELVLNADTMAVSTLSEARALLGGRYELLKVSGNVFGFGVNIPENRWYGHQEAVSGVQFWVSEYPVTRLFDLRTGAEGEWSFYVLKRTDRAFAFSMTYEKDFWPEAVETAVFGHPLAKGNITVKSNTHELSHADLPNVGQQLPDELFFNMTKKTVETQLSAALGFPYAITDLTLMTIGKSWASMYDARLPHGDAGALLQPLEPLAFPSLALYFNDRVQLDPAQVSSSFDGGIAVFNRGPGTYRYTAVKTGVSYATVSFTVDSSTPVDAYVASPPYSIQGTNASGPREQ